MKKAIIPIKGMHCKAYELLISDELKKIPGIKQAKVSYQRSQAEILSSKDVPLSTIRQAVKTAGYEVGEDTTPAWFSRNPEDYKDLLIVLPLFFALLVLAKRLGLSNLSLGGSGDPSSLMVVALVGLTAGLSTCMALVGGLVLGVSARHAALHSQATPMQKFTPHLFFNLGRISSYFILGGLTGLLGKAFQMSSTLIGILTIIAALIMLFLGIQLSGLIPILSRLKITFGLRDQTNRQIINRKDKQYSHLNAMILGALTFFLPCGFTQSMQVYAMSTGSFLSGALIMSVFALGTAPGLLGVGGLSSLFRGNSAKRFFKFSGLVVIALAIFNFSNGINLLGIDSLLASGSSSADLIDINDPNVRLENGFQIVSMTQTAGGYKPNTFTIQKGIPVKWEIDAKAPSSCSGAINAPKMGVLKYLEKGQNTIEFTPKETGDIKFTCTMGMYSGKFKVVDPVL